MFHIELVKSKVLYGKDLPLHPNPNPNPNPNTKERARIYHFTAPTEYICNRWVDGLAAFIDVVKAKA